MESPFSARGTSCLAGVLVPLAVDDFPLMRSWFVVQRRSLPLLPVQARLRNYVLQHGQPIIEEIARAQANRGFAAAGWTKIG
jgi:hypothetical protein